MQVLTQYSQDFPEAIAALEEAQRNAQVRRERLANENATLSIGIMGQVKAGKSSFLNSLLFNGQSLLPEAATPKTANLTRIRYADKPKFIAHFYKPADWAEIEKQAKSDGLDERTKAAQELVKSAKASGDDINKLLVQGKFEIEADNLDSLLGQLNEYTGSDGRLTALVAETELSLPVDLLKDVEIVDTPGMNDPVLSRTEKTREYMARCDVVFFLSRASQFLDASDQHLIASQLPQNGIKRLIVVAAQFDMAILDDGFNRKNLEACTSRLKERLARHAEKIFTNLATQNEQIDKPKIAELLRSLDAPIFTSTHAWQIANTAQGVWPVGVKHTHKELCELAQDSWNTELSEQDWQKLANWEPLTSGLEKSRQERDIILAAQRDSVEKEIQEQEADLLRQLCEQAEARKHALESNDLHSLAEQEETQQAQVDKISQVLSSYLRGTINQTSKREQELLAEMNTSAQRAGNLQERTGYKKERNSYKVSDSTWYKPWTWGSSHTESYSTTSSYSYLAVSDALENLRFYVQNTRTQMLAAFDDLIAPSTISAGLRRELLRSIDPNSPDFDAKGLRALVESSLTGLKLPKLDFQEPDLESVFAGFSGEVKSSSDMASLREKLNTEVNAINSQLARSLTQAVKEASATLETIAGQLNSKLTERLADELSRLRADMADKEENISKINNLLIAISKSL